MRWAVSVTMPACEPVNETAGSPRSMIAMQSSAIEMRSPDGEQHVHLARAAGSLDTSWARRSRSSVVLPMAETTTTTSSPARRVRTMCSATARMRSGSATDVPPNFWTSRLTTGNGTGEAPSDPGVGFRASVDSPAVPKATKRERQRQNREIRREAMLAGREAPQAHRGPPATSGLLLIPVVIVFVVLQVINGDDSGSSSSAARPIAAPTGSPPADHDADVRGGARDRPSTRRRSTRR